MNAVPNRAKAAKAAPTKPVQAGTVMSYAPRSLGDPNHALQRAALSAALAALLREAAEHRDFVARLRASLLPMDQEQVALHAQLQCTARARAEVIATMIEEIDRQAVAAGLAPAPASRFLIRGYRSSFPAAVVASQCVDSIGLVLGAHGVGPCKPAVAAGIAEVIEKHVEKSRAR